MINAGVFLLIISILYAIQGYAIWKEDPAHGWMFCMYGVANSGIIWKYIKVLF